MVEEMTFCLILVCVLGFFFLPPCSGSSVHFKNFIRLGGFLCLLSLQGFLKGEK